MAGNNDMMDAEEFFGETREKVGAVSRRMRHAGRKGPSKNLFAEVKAKMVMRVYGVSRNRALEIISEHESKTRAAEAARSRDEGSSRDGVRLMSAKDFFGA